MRIATAGTQVVIPPKRNRKILRSYDTDLNKERNRIELKQFWRVDRILTNFMGFVKLTAIAIWLR